MSTPSILSAIQNLRELLTRREKFKWLGIVAFAIATSVLEVMTASVIVVFAQVLNQPEMGVQHLARAGFSSDLSPARAVFFFSVIVGVFYLFKNLFVSFEVFFQNFSIQKMNYTFKNKLLCRYAEIDYGVYLTRNSSLAVQVVGGDVERIFSSGLVPLASLISEGAIFLSLIGFMAYINPSLFGIILGVGTLMALGVTKIVLPRFYRLGQQLQESMRRSYQNLVQFLHAFKEILILGKREIFISLYQENSIKRATAEAVFASLNSLSRIVIEILFVGLFVSVIAFLCLKHEEADKMIGLLGGYLYIGFRLMPGLNRIIHYMNNFKALIPSIERVHQEYTAMPTGGAYIESPALQFNRNIVLQGVSFRYLNTHTDALNHIHLEIKKGERIGIVGQTGSGKSTLVDLILGLLRPYEGSILVDGQYPVNSYQWHQKIGYVPQNIYLIDETVEKNIAFGEEEIDPIRLNAAIDAAQLRRFIDSLPEGIKTPVGEQGLRLSGGERQRIAIARVLYRNSEVLVFDEATSALDSETETLLMDTLHAVSKDRTVIMIAHRLTTLKECDRIVVMDKGTILKITDYEGVSQPSS